MKWVTRRHASDQREAAQSEWHRWFAWYPVVIMIEGGEYRVWLEYIERKLGAGRYTGKLKWRYRRVRSSEANW